MKHPLIGLLILWLVACGGEDDTIKEIPPSYTANFEIITELPADNEHFEQAHPVHINTSFQGQVGYDNDSYDSDTYDYFRADLEYGKVYRISFNTDQKYGTKLKLLNSKQETITIEEIIDIVEYGRYSEIIFAPFEDDQYWIEVESYANIPTVYQLEISEADSSDLTGYRASMCGEGIRNGVMTHDNLVSLADMQGNFNIRLLFSPGTCSLESISASCVVTRDEVPFTYYYNYDLLLIMGGFDSIKRTFCDVHAEKLHGVTITTEFKVIKPLIQ